jgi:hypothetical protein
MTAPVRLTIKKTEMVNYETFYGAVLNSPPGFENDMTVKMSIIDTEQVLIEGRSTVPRNQPLGIKSAYDEADGQSSKIPLSYGSYRIRTCRKLERTYPDRHIPTNPPISKEPHERALEARKSHIRIVIVTNGTNSNTSLCRWMLGHGNHHLEDIKLNAGLRVR